MEKITFRCPSCGKRLFDFEGLIAGRISIKCTRCKTLTVFEQSSVTTDTEKH